MDAGRNRHSWSGWPGAFCLKCGADDPIEEAIALNDFDPGYPEYQEPWGAWVEALEPFWICPPEKQAEYEQRMICPVPDEPEQDRPDL